jgi:hypothetical protein
LKRKEIKKPLKMLKMLIRGEKITICLKLLLKREEDIGGKIKRAVIRTIPTIFIPKIVAIPKIR